MKILITGSAGFIGSKVKEKLEKLGHEVSSFDLAEGRNLLNYAEVETAIADKDVVFHIAAEADLTKMLNFSGAENGVKVNVE